ncbi:Asp/Glu/hydantoin racemase [Actinomadura luteofluorescens]|uniref:Asp/Glu/hydantoin racemase n=1 Tax=Actinomadura luteofluorescens TaxID=46163 RepID=A0A7Y9JCR9_9ACTN|nr:aspartate/glutamate racemase family protein [Actinomadura luteofluorescens]NYD44230.1 Asp/Glu/hydantoin racemase [Actinomadura luteofluorescens]
MRALAVTPIHLLPEEIRRRQARYDRLAPPGLSVELRDVGPAAPGALDDEASIRASEHEVAAALARAGDGWDLAFPDCVLDPAVPTLPAPDQGVPVNGLLRLSSLYLSAMNVRFGAVVRNEAIGAELRRRLTAYGLDARTAGIEVLDLPFDAVADAGAWNAALGAAAGALAAAGATAVINGCSAVDVAEHRFAARIVDPTALALRLMAIGRSA